MIKETIYYIESRQDYYITLFYNNNDENKKETILKMIYKLDDLIYKYINLLNYEN